MFEQSAGVLRAEADAIDNQIGSVGQDTPEGAGVVAVSGNEANAPLLQARRKPSRVASCADDLPFGVDKLACHCATRGPSLPESQLSRALEPRCVQAQLFDIHNDEAQAMALDQAELTKGPERARGRLT